MSCPGVVVPACSQLAIVDYSRLRYDHHKYHPIQGNPTHGAANTRHVINDKSETPPVWRI